MRTHIIYIPGLGDGYEWFRTRALSSWRLGGVEVTHIPMTWYDGRSMSAKLDKIMAAIDRVPSGCRVVLIGESAGATLALHAASQSKLVYRVITVCGVVSRDTPISTQLQKRSPALAQATRTIPWPIQADTHTIRAYKDWVVNRQYSTRPEATVHTIWLIGHLLTIVACLTILMPLMITIAKSSKT